MKLIFDQNTLYMFCLKVHHFTERASVVWLALVNDNNAGHTTYTLVKIQKKKDTFSFFHFSILSFFHFFIFSLFPTNRGQVFVEFWFQSFSMARVLRCTRSCEWKVKKFIYKLRLQLNIVKSSFTNLLFLLLQKTKEMLYHLVSPKLEIHLILIGLRESP